MPSRRQIIRHVFGGGWATDFGPTAEIGVQGNIVELPFLVNAENVFFEFDGGPHKVGGTEKFNSTAIESATTNITALFDYWRQGAGGAPAQRVLVAADNSTVTKIYNDDGSASFSSLIADWTSDAVVSFTQLDDVVLIMSSKAADNMHYWDQTTLTELTGPTIAGVPRGAFGASHKNRLWVSGYEKAPSRLYYSVLVDNFTIAGTDWTDSGSGFIDIDPNDGDKITAVISHNDDLWVFKGPYKGSIHRIQGSAPTGADGFSRTTFVRGIGAVGQNSVFRFRNDLGFMWIDGSVHSLTAVDAFGDYTEASLSRPINGYLRSRVTTNRLEYAWSATDVSRGCVSFAIPTDAEQLPNVILCMDYRFDPPRWSNVPAFAATSGGEKGAYCVAEVIDTTDANRPTLMAGGTDGFVRKLNRATRSIDGDTAYTAKVTTPFLHYGNPMQYKEIADASVGVLTAGGGDVTFGWTRDGGSKQTQDVSQGSTAVLAEGSSGAMSGVVDAGGGEITFTLSAGHTIVVGDNFVISGTTNYNDDYTATAVSGNDVTAAGTDAGSEPGTWFDPDPNSGFFYLDESELGGAQFVDLYMDLVTGGEFRQIQYEVTQGDLAQDLELHSITAAVKPGSLGLEN